MDNSRLFRILLNLYFAPTLALFEVQAIRKIFQIKIATVNLVISMMLLIGVLRILGAAFW